MSEIKKATLEDFLAKKIKREENKSVTIDVYVTSMDRTITLKNPTEEQLLDYANRIGANNDVRESVEANRRLIYLCCEELQDPKLHEILEIKDPLDAPRVLFDINDVKEIMNQFKKLISPESINKKIKN